MKMKGIFPGKCSWVSPIVEADKKWSETGFSMVKKGAYPGETNGVKMILDAEVFDYGPGLSRSSGRGSGTGESLH